MTAVFVYGTFLPGESRWPLLEPFAASVDAANARGQLWDTGRGYPAARFDVDGTIPGAVVALRAETEAGALVRLDEIESEGTLYRRITIDTSHGPAQSYEWLGPTDGLRVLAVWRT